MIVLHLSGPPDFCSLSQPLVCTVPVCPGANRLRNTNKSGVTGQGMKEAQNINKSLSALGDVIQSLVVPCPQGRTKSLTSKQVLDFIPFEQIIVDIYSSKIVCLVPGYPF